jgi:hypothetical protein
VLKNLQLTNFRGFEQLELKQLNRVNLIVGDNNTGKTSILEALYLLLGDGSQIKELAGSFRATEAEGKTAARGQDTLERFWLWLFRDHRIDNRLNLKAQLHDERRISVSFIDASSGVSTAKGNFKRALSKPGDDPNPRRESIIDFNEDGTLRFPGVPDIGLRMSRLSVRPSNPVEDATLFNKTANRPGGEEAAEGFMRKIEGRLKKLRYRKLHEDSDAVIYAELAGLSEFIPTTQLGQAFARMLHIFCEVNVEKSGVLLADEIENGIYHGNLHPFWKALYELAGQQKSQIFATTHSFECMKAAHQAACERADQGGTYDLNIIRLDRVDWGIKATEFGRETMEVAIAKGWEMR